MLTPRSSGILLVLLRVYETDPTLQFFEADYNVLLLPMGSHREAFWDAEVVFAMAWSIIGVSTTLQRYNCTANILTSFVVHNAIAEVRHNRFHMVMSQMFESTLDCP